MIVVLSSTLSPAEDGFGNWKAMASSGKVQNVLWTTSLNTVTRFRSVVFCVYVNRTRI